MKKKKPTTTSGTETTAGGSKVKKSLKFNFLDDEAEEEGVSDSDITDCGEEY